MGRVRHRAGAKEWSWEQASEAIRRAEAAYAGIPGFAGWAGLPPERKRLWGDFAGRLRAARERVGAGAFERAVEVAARAASVDSAAIEGLFPTDRGFTMSVALQQLAWEMGFDERSDDARAYFEAQLEAFEMVVDAATARRPITEQWLRALHRTICAPQATHRVLTPVGWQEQPLPAGAYKAAPNSPVGRDGRVLHAYAPVDRVPSEMHRLIEQLREPAFEAAHPAEQAAYAHWSLVAVHPFADGNGRVARALASVFLYRAESIPLVVFVDQKPEYLEALAAADRGDSAALVRFVADRGLDTMRLVAGQLHGDAGRQPDEIAENLEGVGYDVARRQPSVIELLARRLLLSLEDQVMRGDRAPDRPPHTTLEAKLGDDDLILTVDGDPSAARAVKGRARVIVSPDVTAPFPLCLRRGGRDGGDELEVRLDDVDPEISRIVRLRLESFARRWLEDLRAGRSVRPRSAGQ